MNSDLEKLFEQAIFLTGAQREEFLAQHCTDPMLRQQLEELLAHDQGAETFLQTAVSAVASSLMRTLVLSPGQRLGPYRVVSVIGSGGMGLVYLAERADGKFEQRVAIKVLQNGLDREALAERIQQECRILASLEHANIARVVDAGISPDGLPYFAMEYVDGQPIDRYCEEHKLSVRGCMRLLLPVCDVVHFAHQKLIVHRDLKPDNILVTEQGIPKLLDFGIAKVLSEVPVSPQNTVTCVLTPEYASPEQARGEPVTTATDIYSLGGVLYKLLTGSAPHQLQNKSPVEAVGTICDEEVRKPSELRRELTGDIDSILLMALRKEPQRRYRSVDEFAADIRNFLDQKPVIARADTLWYRSRKYVRRHFVAVGTATAIVLLMGIFAVLQGIQLRQTRRERDRANRITEFMTNMFQVSDPSKARGNSVTAREILDKASSDIGKGLERDPEAQAQMMRVMGLVYWGLGLYPRAESLMSRALDVRQRVFGPDNADTLQSMIELADVLGKESRWPEGEKLYRKVLEARRRVLGPQNPDTLISMLRLANCLGAQGHHDEAVKLEREALVPLSRLLGPNHVEILNSMQQLLRNLTDSGNFLEAEQVARQLLDSRTRVQGPDHPDTLRTASDLGWVLREQGRYAEAESFLREAVATGRRVLGAEHPLEVGMATRLAIDLSDEGRVEEAEKLQREQLELRRRIEGPASYGALATQQNLALTLVDEGEYAEAETLLHLGVETGRQSLGPQHPLILLFIGVLGHTLSLEGRTAEAEKLEREAIDLQRRVIGREHPDTLAVETYLAGTLARQGRYSEAEALARNTLDIQLRIIGRRHSDTLATIQSLGIALTHLSRYNESKELLNDTINQISSKRDASVGLAWYSFACVAAAANDRDGAIQHLRNAINNGYQDVPHMRTEDNLKSLRGDPRFKALLTGLELEMARTQPIPATAVQ